MTVPELLTIVPFIVVALVAITFHEAAHAYVASACGDDTAKKLGRVTLNPLRHIDLLGTVLIPAVLYAIHAPFLFGWAKPVPVHWGHLRHARRDMMMVAAAGPAANFLLAVLCGLIGAALAEFSIITPVWLTDALAAAVWLNLLLAVFNLIPIPPLDGSKVLAGMLPTPLALRFLGLGRKRPKSPVPTPDSK
jgi:Zn-dependent protease